jgi:hypothetical protein
MENDHRMRENAQFMEKRELELRFIGTGSIRLRFWNF